MLELLTVVYGQAHIERFVKGTLRSMAWKKNRASLYRHKAKWNIFTDDASYLTLHKLTDAFLPELNVQIQSTAELRGFTDPVQSALVGQIKQCLANKSKMLMCPPDTIFGDGSIENLVNLSYEPETCLAVAHARVLPSILTNDLSFSQSNPELVSLAWQHLHRSWSEARVGCENQHSYVGGVAWTEVSPGLIQVQHRLPTVYLAQFTPEDLQYFECVISSGHYDHKWPADILYPRGRFRYLGSSDFAFMVEITEAEKNVPPYQLDANPYDFWQKNTHNEINKQISITFRGA